MRKTLAAAVVALATLPAAAQGVAAQDISGTWHIEGSAADEAWEQTLTLVQDGMDLSGSVSADPDGPGGNEPIAIPLEYGTVFGSTYTFSITLQFGDDMEQRLYSGTFDQESIRGSVRLFSGTALAYSGKRAG